MTNKYPMPYMPWKVCDCGDDTLPPHIDQNGPHDTLAIADIDEVVSQVHLSDAECAAEYWRAKWETEYHLPGARMEYGEDKKADLWYRMATHPHAHEEQS